MVDVDNLDHSHHVSYLVLLAILAACAGPVLIFEGKLGWPDVPKPAFRPWLEIMIIMIILNFKVLKIKMVIDDCHTDLDDEVMIERMIHLSSSRIIWDG